METHHEVPLTLWNLLKAEITAVLVGVAKRKSLISYSDLVRKISTFRLDPDSHALHEILGEISIAEDEWDRGMLSVLVVHKHGDQQPGKGFFKLAESLGRDTSDQAACWVAELQLVYASHRGNKR